MTATLSMTVVAGHVLVWMGSDGEAAASGLVILETHLDAGHPEATVVALRTPVPAAAVPDGYAALRARAGERLGAPPGRLTIDNAFLALDDQTWPGPLGEVFGGDLEIRFQPTGAAESYRVATVTSDHLERAGGAVVVDGAAFDSDRLPAEARAAILAGDFHALIAGPAAAPYRERRAPLLVYLVVGFQFGA